MEVCEHLTTILLPAAILWDLCLKQDCSLGNELNYRKIVTNFDHSCSQSREQWNVVAQVHICASAATVCPSLHSVCIGSKYSSYQVESVLSIDCRKVYAPVWSDVKLGNARRLSDSIWGRWCINSPPPPSFSKIPFSRLICQWYWPPCTLPHTRSSPPRDLKKTDILFCTVWTWLTWWRTENPLTFLGLFLLVTVLPSFKVLPTIYVYLLFDTMKVTSSAYENTISHVVVCKSCATTPHISVKLKMREGTPLTNRNHDVKWHQ